MGLAVDEMLICPICVKARQLNEAESVPHSQLAGATPMLEWLGDGDATVFSY